MRTRTTWVTVAAGCAVAGGGAWLLKQGAIAASVGPDGAAPENAVIGVLYLSGLVLMLAAATGVGAWLLRGRPAVVRVPVALLLAPVIFFGVQTAMDALVDGLAADDAHWWWAGEGGIVLTALLFAGVGALVFARSRRAVGRSAVPA
jgi:hypothetical protein